MMDESAVNVSSVRTIFESGGTEANNDKSRLTPNTKKRNLVPKQEDQTTYNGENESESGPKRATLVREIQSLPKNSVMKRLQMFEGEQEQKDVKQLTPSPIHNKPNFPQRSIHESSYPENVKDEIKTSERKSGTEEVKATEIRSKEDIEVTLTHGNGEGTDTRTNVRQSVKPPRPPPSYRNVSLHDDTEGNTTVTKSNNDGEEHVQIKYPLKEKGKQPSQPQSPSVRKSFEDKEKPTFTVKLVSKTSTHMTFPENWDSDSKSLTGNSLSGKFQTEYSPKPHRKPKPNVESVLKLRSEKPEDQNDTSAELKAKDNVRKPEMPENTTSEKFVDRLKPRIPPKKPPPPKPPRTFQHDIYLKSKRHLADIRSHQNEKDQPVYELYDDKHRYEPVVLPESSKTPHVVVGAWSPVQRNASLRSDHSYETVCYTSSSLCDNSHYHQDGSYRSYASYTSVRSLTRSTSDECLYARPSTLFKLTQPLNPLYAVPNKKPPLPPKHYLDDGNYALPYVDSQFTQTCELKRSRSYREELNQGRHLEKLDDQIRRKFNRNQKSPVSHRLEGIKSTVYNDVRDKVDEAYSLLSYHELDSTNHTTLNVDNDSDDSDSQIDLCELQRRREHVSANREKNRGVYEKIRLIRDSLYPSLFQYGLIIGLKQQDGICVPDLKFSFPQYVTLEDTHVADFCFPDLSVCVPVMQYESETFSFVLTLQDGSRNYGYCRRLLPGNESGARLPVVVCIVSPLGAHQLYTQVLDEVESRFHVSEDHAEELLQAVYAKPLPSPGSTINVKSLNNKGITEVLSFTRASDMRLENVKLDLLFSCLSMDNVVRIFASVLLERRILFSASKLSTLTNGIHALVSLLYPLKWEHTFIPVLPQSLLEMCCSPTPYIIGVLSVHINQVDDLPTEEILIVDLDRNRLRSSFDDEDSILPRKLQKALTTVIKLALEETDTASHRHLLLSEAFLRLFVEAIGHYAEHIYTTNDGRREFVKETFCECVASRSLCVFLEWLTETHLFQIFIMEQMQMQDKTTLSLFDTRIMEHREKLANMPLNAWSNFRQWAKKMRKAIRTNMKGQADVKKCK